MDVEVDDDEVRHRDAELQAGALRPVGWKDAREVASDLESLDEVPDDDLLEFTATMMTYHMGQAGKLETVSRETTASLPDPLAVLEILAGQKSTAEVGE